MKQKSIVIACYATLVLIGGIIGYVVAHSSVSLIMSGLFAILLYGCSAFVWRGNLMAYNLATSAIFCLLAFFCYRFLLTNKLAPAGIMSLISGGLLVYLVAARKQLSRDVQERSEKSTS
jgi:uncharacterized membrane protein (UPF0136 family)